MLLTQRKIEPFIREAHAKAITPYKNMVTTPKDAHDPRAEEEGLTLEEDEDNAHLGECRLM